jgi:predicted transposase YdaD
MQRSTVAAFDALARESALFLQLDWYGGRQKGKAEGRRQKGKGEGRKAEGRGQKVQMIDRT